LSEILTPPVARCPADGTVVADPAPRWPGPLVCPRCWLMFGYDPDEVPPVEPVEIRPGQLWAPRPVPVRVIGFPEADEVPGVNMRTGDWVRMKAPPARSRDVFVVAEPAFASGEFPRRMVDVEVRPGGEVVEVESGFSVPCSARQLAEGYMQAFYELVADPIGGAS
jgi:hypothetical protein